MPEAPLLQKVRKEIAYFYNCLLYTSDAADERSSVDLGGRRIIKKKQNTTQHTHNTHTPVPHSQCRDTSSRTTYETSRW